MKRWIFLLICIAMSSGKAEYLELQSAYKQVLESNDGLKSTQHAVQKQEKLNLASKMLYLPQVSLGAYYVRLQEPMNMHLVNQSQLGNLGGNIGGNPALAPLLQHLGQPVTLQDQNVIFGAVNIIYPIFTGGKRYFANKLSQIALEDSYLALKLKELSLFEDCVKLYYGVVLNKQILYTLESANSGHQVNYDKSSIDVKKASDNLIIANMALNAMLNRESKERLELVKQIDIKQDARLESLEYFINKTLEVYPALSLMDNKIESAKELSHIEFSTFLPEVGLFGSYMMNDNSSVLDKAMPNWFAGVGAKWSLITPGGRIQKYQASKIASIEAELAKSQATKDLKTLCEKTYNEVLSFKSQYFSLQSSIELANENLKLRQKAFLQGMSTSAEVSDAQNALALAIIERQSVAYNYAIALARLLSLSDEVDRFYGFFN